jgi:predicted Zn-dependent protease
LEKAQECLNLYPDNNMVNVMAASVCSKMEKWEEALHYINTALKRAPKMASLYLYKSSFLSQIGEAQQAKHVLEEGIKRKVDVSGTLQTELEKLQEQYPDN